MLDDGESRVGSTEPYSDVLWYYGEIERATKEILANQGLIEEGGSISLYRLVTIAREKQLMPLKLISAVPKFGGISNKMAQGNLEVVDESTLSEAASIGNDILGMVLAVAETTGHKKENHE